VTIEKINAVGVQSGAGLALLGQLLAQGLVGGGRHEQRSGGGSCRQHAGSCGEHNCDWPASPQQERRATPRV
jgi:hypothetical protein